MGRISLVAMDTLSTVMLMSFKRPLGARVDWLIVTRIGNGSQRPSCNQSQEADVVLFTATRAASHLIVGRQTRKT